MDILESCHAIRKKLSKSGLHYLIHETPFSLLIKIKKKRIGENDSEEGEPLSGRTSFEDEIQQLKAQIKGLEKEIRNIHSNLRQNLIRKKENIKEENRDNKEKDYKLNNLPFVREKKPFDKNLNRKFFLNEPRQKLKESINFKSSENIMQKIKSRYACNYLKLIMSL